MGNISTTPRVTLATSFVVESQEFSQKFKINVSEVSTTEEKPRTREEIEKLNNIYDEDGTPKKTRPSGPESRNIVTTVKFEVDVVSLDGKLIDKKDTPELIQKLVNELNENRGIKVKDTTIKVPQFGQDTTPFINAIKNKFNFNATQFSG